MKPRNCRSSFTLVGGGHSTTAEIFSGSVEIPSSEMICPRYESDCLKSSHFEGFSFNPFSANFLNTLSKRWQCSSKVFEKNQYIIEKNQTFFQVKFPHTFLHESLKSCWDISKVKTHSIAFVKSKITYRKSSFVFILFL